MQSVPGFVAGTAISPDNKYLLTSTYGQGEEFELVDGRPHRTAAVNHPLRLTNLDSGEPVADVKFPGRGSSQVAFSPDGRHAAIAVIGDEPAIYIVSIPSLEIIRRTETLSGPPRGLAYSRSGKRLAASIADTTILVWDVDQLPPGRE